VCELPPCVDADTRLSGDFGCTSYLAGLGYVPFQSTGTEHPLREPFGSNDLHVLSRYEHAGQGAWTTMPEADKEAYRKIHARLEQILAGTLSAFPGASSLDKCVTLGFNPTGGVRGNRPKDLWCAIFPRGAEAYMPQVYLIVSHRGIELGYAAAIHPRDFSDQAFKAKLKSLAPRIFHALPDPTSDAARELSAELVRQGHWYFRRKTRLSPKENDFGGLSDLLSFLKSAEGTAWGAGTVTRYWLPHELSDDVDLAEEFLNATRLFQPLMVRAATTSIDLQPALEPAVPSIPIETPPSGGIRDGLETFMAMYPECRSRPFGTHPGLASEKWRVPCEQ
jgi:hypothetical protein